MITAGDEADRRGIGQSQMQTLLRNDLGAFIHRAFLELSPGRSYKPNWHLDALAWHLTGVMEGRIKRLLINVPPRSLKSHSASIAFPAWVLGNRPATRMICISYANDLAIEHANAFRKLIRAPWYSRAFPRMRINPRKDRETEVRTTDGGGRITTTTCGALTGRGGGIIVIDDPIKAADAESEVVRSRTNKWFDETLLTRLDEKKTDSIVLVMQRLHVDDLAGHVLAKGGWVHLDLPAIAESESLIEIGPGTFHHRRVGDVLHPQRESETEIEVLKRDMGSAAFSAQYQQMPVPAGGNMIKWSWFGQYATPPENEYPATIVQSWDTASKAGELNDYSVGITALLVKDAVYILDVFRDRLDYPNLKKKIKALKERWDAETILIEDKGSGTSLIQDLKSEHCFAKPIEAVADKTVRMSACSARIEAGAVFLPVAANWLDDFRTEMLAFPNGRHDDQADALSQLLNWARKPPSRYTKENIG